MLSMDANNTHNIIILYIATEVLYNNYYFASHSMHHESE